jgi:hypothetical protein
LAGHSKSGGSFSICFFPVTCAYFRLFQQFVQQRFCSSGKIDQKMAELPAAWLAFFVLIRLNF